jgi:hypothetical protein
MFNLLWRNRLFRNQSYSSFNKSVYWSTDYNEDQYYQEIVNLTQTLSKLKNLITEDQFPILPEHFSNKNPYAYDMYDEKLQLAYKNTSISIITESQPAHNHEMFFPTEKTFRAIALQHPFIIFGQPRFYKHLTEMGYQTFESIWNEKFDNIDNPWQRAKYINQVVTKLTTMSNKEFNNIVSKTKHITEHNYNTFLKRTDPKTIISKLNKKIKPAFLRFNVDSYDHCTIST